MFSDQEIIKGVLSRDVRAISRLISLSEDRNPRAREIQASLFKYTGSSHIIGVTGSPGAGKSTLVDRMAKSWTTQGHAVAILAVDPTSPFSGGAILGDRIRMTESSEESGIFIRSMATRGSLGGVSRATLEATQILDAAGYDIVLVETVGVGQAEVDIVRMSDTCIVVVVPGMGDGIQALKAGILEIGDVFVINKADRDGADLVQKDLRVLLSLAEKKPDLWTPPICRTVATTAEGVEDVLSSVKEHAKWLKKSLEGEKRKLRIIEDMILNLTSELIEERIFEDKAEMLDRKVLECFQKKIDPYRVVEELLTEVPKKRSKTGGKVGNRTIAKKRSAKKKKATKRRSGKKK